MESIEVAKAINDGLGRHNLGTPQAISVLAAALSVQIIMAGDKEAALASAIKQITETVRSSLS